MRFDDIFDDIDEDKYFDPTFADLNNKELMELVEELTVEEYEIDDTPRGVSFEEREEVVARIRREAQAEKESGNWNPEKFPVVTLEEANRIFDSLKDTDGTGVKSMLVIFDRGGQDDEQI